MTARPGWWAGSKRIVHAAVHAAGFTARLARSRGVMRIVMFHGVGDGILSADAFTRLLVWLKKEFDVVPLSELVGRVADPDRVTGREVALTFDDGLRNNATVAAPLLARHELHGTFFVCPALIEEQRWLWNHEMRARLRTLSPETRASLAAELQPPVASGDIEAFVDQAKRLSPAQRGDLEAMVREATPQFAPDPEQKVRHDPMSWDELRALDPRHVTIGSHTLSHPILPTLDLHGLEREIADSRTQLEHALDRPVTCFCYPNGSEDARVRECVARTYQSAVTVLPGWVRAGDDTRRLSRIGERPCLYEFAWRMYRP